MTTIEWTHVPDNNGGRKKGETINPQVGCREKSPGCRNCYAAKLAARGMSPQHRGLTRSLPLLDADGKPVLDKRGRAKIKPNSAHWNGEIRRVPEQLEQVLRWRQPRGIFWGSMTDLFIESNMETEEARRFVAACFGVMAATPQHTHMVLTKRPRTMRQWFEWIGDEVALATYTSSTGQWCMHEAWAHLQGRPPIRRVVERIESCGSLPPWPLPNVWIGTTTEDQKRADERIPDLLATPAAVRFLSVEPMLGPVDLNKWIGAVDRCGFCEAERAGIGKDHCDECGRDGYMVTAWGTEQLERLRSGERYDDENPDDDGPRIHWVICGGESGQQARPMHPEWLRDLRDQCVAAGVPFFFKQKGTFIEVGQAANDTSTPAVDAWTHVVALDGRCFKRGTDTPLDVFADPNTAYMRKTNKHEAGRMLDGRTWDEFPEAP